MLQSDFKVKLGSKRPSVYRIFGAMSVLCAALSPLNSAFAAGDPSYFVTPAGQFVTYGDARSYALQVSCVVGGFNGTGCPYYVQSGPGQIQSLVVNGTGSNGGPVNTNFPNMDDAYSFPNTSNNTGIGQLSDWFIRTGGQTIGSGSNTVTFGARDPGGAGEWSGTSADQANTWDTRLDALKSFLTTGNGQVLNPVFFFNNNQTNSGTSADQVLAAWARLWITDANGIQIGAWEFTNNNGLYASIPFGGGIVNDGVSTPWTSFTSTLTNPRVNTANSHTDYVLSGGKVCLDASGNPQACDGTEAFNINNNLGANQAAYAIDFPELNAALQGLFTGNFDLTKYNLHIDIRLGCDPLWFGSDPTSPNIDSACSEKRLTNGYEQMFMGRLAPEGTPPPVPEPGTLALVGGALALLATRRRRMDSQA